MEKRPELSSDERWEAGFTADYIKDLLVSDMSHNFTEKELEYLVDQLDRSGPDNWLTDKLKEYHYARYGRGEIVKADSEKEKQIEKDVKDWVKGLLES
jgi:hypothetical protein